MYESIQILSSNRWSHIKQVSNVIKWTNDAIEAYIDKGSVKNSDIPEWHAQDNDG